MSATKEDIARISGILNNSNRPLKERFRALFTLKNIGGSDAIDAISKAFNDESALLKHEVAYCLGQMRDERAIPVLEGVLRDQSREAIVRHEAGEALGAIGSSSVITILKEFVNDPVQEVSDTCKLAVARIEYFEKGIDKTEKLTDNPYNSVDPAPPLPETDVKKLKQVLLDEDAPLFERYRAMFSLRNDGSEESVRALAEGLVTKNTLMRHEIAYVLGQIQSEASKAELLDRLRDPKENDMVRHECAEALGSIATEDINKELEKYLDQSQPSVLRESCVIALDFSEYNSSDQFQYADCLSNSA